jgi:hypothetical protein
MNVRTRYIVTFEGNNGRGAVFKKSVCVSIPTFISSISLTYDGLTNGETNSPTTELDAIEPAIRKMFGSTAIWKEDRGVSPKYGQVFKPTKLANYSSITGMAWLEIVKGW